jgi:hypothetical protein
VVVNDSPLMVNDSPLMVNDSPLMPRSREAAASAIDVMHDNVTNITNHSPLLLLLLLCFAQRGSMRHNSAQRGSTGLNGAQRGSVLHDSQLWL